MQRNFFVIVLLVVWSLSGVSCRPREVLSSRQMEDVLVDLHTADGVIYAADIMYGHEDALKKYYEMVLEKHGLTQAQFDSSLVWYTNNPQIFNKIYPRVIERLQQSVDVYSAELEHLKQLEEQAAHRVERDIRPWQHVRHDYVYGVKLCWYEAPLPIPYVIPYASVELSPASTSDF